MNKSSIGELAGIFGKSKGPERAAATDQMPRPGAMKHFTFLSACFER